MADPDSKLRLTPDERAFRDVNRATYNAGRVREAYEQAVEFFRRNPGSLFGKYWYATMCGDYAEDASLPEGRRAELLVEARRLIAEVYAHPDLDRWELASGARNEYFWFHGLHQEQYHLGEARVSAGEKRGYYSMCVGASCMAVKCVREQLGRDAARDWAAKAAAAFAQFELLDPAWHNINPFYARALAVLGDAPGALAAYRDMFRKQGVTADEAAVASFRSEIAGLLP